MNVPAKPDAKVSAVGGFRLVPRTVIALGFVSLCMDTSSEIIHSLLPAFLVTVLGANALSIGIIEGAAEATTAISRIFSGALSDGLGKRKLLVLIGYGLAAFTKPLFPLATGVGAVFVARFVDRIGKGIRGAPRDALIADVTPLELRGTAFGLRQSMDTVGAFLGPMLAILMMAATGEDFRFAFWIAVIPAALAVLLIVYGVREPTALHQRERRRFPVRGAELARLGVEYWWLVGIATVLTLARFSEAFLLLAAQHAGMALSLIPAVLVLMNITYAASAYPVGRLADRMSRHNLLLMGIIFLKRMASRGWSGRLGPPYGGNPRPAISDRRGCCAGRSPRHGIRTLQFDNRRGDAGSERYRWFALDCSRSSCRLHCRCGIRCLVHNGRNAATHERDNVISWL